MAEVTARTSKSVDLGDMSKKTSGSFDMRSPEGLAALLKAARSAELPETEYAAFRDLVLEYAHGGGTDAALRQKIENISQSFAAQMTVPAAAENKPDATKAVSPGQSGFMGMSRPEPRFNVGETSAPVPDPLKPIKLKVQSAVPDNLPVGTAAMSSKTPVAQKPSAPAAENNEPQRIAIEDAVAETAMPASIVAGMARPPMPAIKTVDEYKARIAEIKRTVNAQVGNPIVLMDGTNAVGREYMSALLAAMKAVSGNAPGTLQSSMMRLEKAFEAVAELGDGAAVQKEEVKASAEARPVAASPEPEIRLPKENPIKIEDVKTEAKSLPPLKESVNMISPQTPLPPQAPAAAAPIRWNEAKKNEVRFANPSKAAVPPSSKPQSFHASTAPIPPVTAMPPLKKAAPQKVGDTSPAVKEGGKHTTKGVGRSGYDVTIPGEKDTPVPPIVSDDLHAPEIDQGLDQLLHEWSLFRGSGLFSTGSGGREHPFFKKLAPLPMEMVAAGTYEGATREAILSVRDYTNGWRHEQGISYLPSESFETYLRRVVKRILRRQA